MQRKGHGKTRNNWRRCPLCQCDAEAPEKEKTRSKGSKGSGKDSWTSTNSSTQKNPMVHICNCPRKIVHYRCQAKEMTESGRIHCNTCGSQYEGVRYEYRSKTFIEYLMSDGNARNGLIALASMLVSLFFTVVALARTIFTDLEVILNELRGLQLNIFSVPSLKHDLRALLLINGRVVLPLVTIYLTATKVQAFIGEYFRWRLQHFAISVLDPEQLMMVAEGGKGGANTPRCKDGKSGGTPMVSNQSSGLFPRLF